VKRCLPVGPIVPLTLRMLVSHGLEFHNRHKPSRAFNSRMLLAVPGCQTMMAVIAGPAELGMLARLELGGAGEAFSGSGFEPFGSFRLMPGPLLCARTTDALPRARKSAASDMMIVFPVPRAPMRRSTGRDQLG
jgi:hypothetical protein